ncbi:MAG TPA: hypothetical protein DEF43_19690 [Chloroflexus aurantiacus]|jgi:hypothetical protein|uniref:hypothetical protein n=1 Tax=Chloroflexus TaxID=1107 RepID=UPI000037B25D|nr:MULTISPECIES: hypothetical protein [Chloroflexus]RMG51726.1 MAG: hypothetical protein D6716_05395 [Chloroflexota bacterium]HBW69326.1 hypothetical protein [Chloroflexus aurantiacus]
MKQRILIQHTDQEEGSVVVHLQLGCLLPPLGGLYRGRAEALPDSVQALQGLGALFPVVRPVPQGLQGIEVGF